jgi:molecular chaperone DnaK (HSP70)
METIEARNALESYVYNVRNFATDEKNREKMGAEVCDECEAKTKVHLDWLDAHSSAEKEEYEAQKKVAEGEFQPFLMKMYAADGKMPQSAAAADPNVNAAAGAAPGPKVEEVD